MRMSDSFNLTNGELNMSEKACCVTGHKDIPIQQINYVKDSLRYEIDKAIAEGYTCSMCGFGDGVDQYFAEIVVEKKKELREIPVGPQIGLPKLN